MKPLKRLLAKPYFWGIGAFLVLSIGFVAWTNRAPQGKIVYAKYLGGENAGIYVMNPNGEDTIRITSFPSFKAPIHSSVWSSDGKQIAFIGNATSGQEIYLVPEEGLFNPENSSDVVNIGYISQVYAESCAAAPNYLSNGGYDLDSLAWSPDGQRLALTCPSQDLRDELVCVIDFHGAGDCWSLSTIVEGSSISGDARVAWAPTQNRLAVSFELHGGVKSRIYLTDLDGENAVFLTEGWNPSWSPSGERLLFFDYENMCIIDRDGSNLECPYVDPRLGPFSFELLSVRPLLIDSTATWSPDERFIAFTASNSVTQAGKGIYLLNLRTKKVKRLTILGDGIFSDPNWSP